MFLYRSLLSLVKALIKWFGIPFHYRSLFFGFIRQELQGRYAGSFGGFLWSILTPLANLLIYIFVFSAIFKIRLKPVETGTASFVVYLLAGLLPWLAFGEAMTNAGNIILSKANLITKVAFPLEILPLSAVLVTFILHGLGFVIFLVYLVMEGYMHIMWVWLPLVIGIHMLFTLGLVILTSSLCVFIRDIQQFIGIVVSLWMYVTPILYPASMVPDNLRWIISLNPAYPFIELYHQVILQHALPYGLLCQGLVIGGLVFIVGILFFDHVRNGFADVL